MQLRLEQRATVAGCLLRTLTVGDFMEEDREAVRRGIDAILEPAIPGRVVALDLGERLVGHRLFVGEMKGLADALGEFSPDVTSEQILRPAAEQLRRAVIHIGVAPVLVECDDCVADPLEHVGAD